MFEKKNRMPLQRSMGMQMDDRSEFVFMSVEDTKFCKNVYLLDLSTV